MTDSLTVLSAATADLVDALSELTDLSRDKRAKVETKGGGSYFYTYTDLAGVLGAVRPILAVHHLAVVQPVRSADGVVAVRTELVHATGERFGSPELTMRQPDGAQALGSAITYLRRYSLLAALGIATEDDDGKAASSSPRQGRGVASGPAPLSESVMEQFGKACVTEGLTTAEVLARAFPAGLPDPLTDEHLPHLRDTFRLMVTEQTTATSGDDVRPATRNQVGLVKANYERMAYDRDDQLATTASVIGRVIDSHNELTLDEAGKVLDYQNSLEE